MGFYVSIQIIPYFFSPQRETVIFIYDFSLLMHHIIRFCLVANKEI